MRYYFAPMEGLTDSIYRHLHHKHFGGVDRYYMPFLSPTMHKTLTPRETRELPEAGSEAFIAVPQILTKVSEDFLWAAQQCAQRGYDEVNLNLGCPSGTVTAKGKGSGMLRDTENLDRFLEEVFSGTPLPISVKTRVGYESPEEFERLLAVFNRYPIKELTIHPRTRKQFYSGALALEQFEHAVKNSTNPLCFNGDIRETTDISKLSSHFPSVNAIMIGRGLIARPGMLSPDRDNAQALAAFMDELLEAYIVAFGGSRNAMFRLKENWSLILPRFQGSEKLGKQLRKTTDVSEYRAITARIFAELPLI